MRVERPVRFLVVEFPSDDFVFTRFTKAHPLATVDLVADLPRVRDGRSVHPTMFLVKRVASREMRMLLDELAQVHEPPNVVRRDPSGLTWLCRADLHVERLGPHGQAMTQFQERFGPPWLHIEQGVLHLRARLLEPTEADALAARLSSFLAATGAQAQVEVREISPDDYGVWEDLLQASSGLAS